MSSMSNRQPHSHAHPHGSSASSKSHVLAGVQDAYWSDEEDENPECPLCLEEMDLSDLNFKPCPCGYQICRFCWHHIKENLNGRCPACRRVYTAEAVEFKPVGPEDQKRLTQQKKLREKERKELEHLNRRHLANVRVVQRNLVYVVGLGPRFAKEELLPTLRSTEYFGKYGKITKIVLVKRKVTSTSSTPVVGLYITYHRREDAARAISAVDGSPSPGADGETMRASYGTTKYCMAFLRGVACTNQGCLELHEWGDERDCFTKEDLATLKHAMKDTENRQRRFSSNTQRSQSDTAEAPALPRTASWAKGATSPSPRPAAAAAVPPGLFPSRTSKHQPRARPAQTQQSSQPSRTDSHQTASRFRTGTDRERAEKKAAAAVLTSSALSISSRPSTPGLASLPSRPSTSSSVPARPPSATSIPVQALTGSAAVDSVPSTSQPEPSVRLPTSTQQPSTIPSAAASSSSVPNAGQATPSNLPSQASTYQLSTQAQALLDDFRSRRDVVKPVDMRSPFPDFDRMLSSLGDGHFAFKLNPKLAGAQAQRPPLPDVTSQPAVPFTGSFDPFASSPLPSSTQDYASSANNVLHHNPSFPSAPPLPLSLHIPEQHPSQTSSSPSTRYAGSFNPFSDSAEDASSNTSQPSSGFLEDTGRRSSRFGFARKTTGSSQYGTSSPFPQSALSVSSSPKLDNALPTTPLYSTSHVVSPQPRPQSLNTSQWGFAQPEYTTMPDGTQPGHSSGFQGVQSVSSYVGSFQPPTAPTDRPMNLQEIMNMGRNQEVQSSTSFGRGPFMDPAIMSVQMGSIPPPGLHGTMYTQNGNPPIDHNTSSSSSFFQSTHLFATADGTHADPSQNANFNPMQPFRAGSNMMSQFEGMSSPSATHASIQASSLVPSPVLSASDFPALPTSGETQPRRDQHHPFIAPRNPEPKPAPSVLRKIPPKSKVVLPPPPVKKIPIQKNSLNSGPIPTKSTLPEPPKPSEVPKSDTAESSYKRRDAEAPSTVSAQASNAAPSKPAPNHPSVPLSRPLEDSQAPILSKKAKKSKAAKPGKAVKDEGSIAVKTEEKAEETPTPVTNSEPPSIPNSPPVSEVARTEANPRESLLDRSGSEQTSLSKLLTQISEDIDLESLNFFNPQSVSPKSQTPLRYGPLVHALSALSVGGGSFANSIPSGSIDSAVSSFQLLLETLTQTISDLLRLLPRTTWDDSSSFDGVLRDMLKAEDFLEEHPEDSLNKEDEVAALTLALEKRARWMEVQLSKLEELHRDINSAAVRAILAFNQRGWDPASFLPRVGDSLTRFDNLGHVEEGEELRPMTIAELEASLTQVRAEEIAAEAALKKAMRINGEHLFV